MRTTARVRGLVVLGLAMAAASVALMPATTLAAPPVKVSVGLITVTRQVATTAEQALFPEGLIPQAGPLSLLSLAEHLPAGPLRSLAVGQAAARAQTDLAQQVSQVVRQSPQLREWMVLDVRRMACRQPRVEDRRYQNDPLLADLLAASVRGSESTPVWGQTGWRADDPALVRIEMDLAGVQPLKPELLSVRIMPAYRQAMNARLSQCGHALRTLSQGLGLGTVAVVINAELEKSLDRSAPQNAELVQSATAQLTSHLTGAGLKFQVLKCPPGRDLDMQAVRVAAAEAKVHGLVVVQILETQGGRTGSRNKSAGVVSLTVEVFGNEPFEWPTREVLGQLRGSAFGTNDSLPPAEAVAGFVETAITHLLADGRLVQAFSEALVKRWATPRAGGAERF